MSCLLVDLSVTSVHLIYTKAEAFCGIKGAGRPRGGGEGEDLFVITAGFSLSPIPPFCPFTGSGQGWRQDLQVALCLCH